MAAKRQAISDLNHDNWDQEEEPEDPGHFKEATGEELKNRVIKKARRRITGENDNTSTNKSIFSGFSGFGSSNNAAAAAASTAKASPFAFLSKLPTSTSNATSTTASTSSSAIGTTTIPSFSFGNTGEKSDKCAPAEKSKDEKIYFSKIMKLNKSFCDWIVKHVNEQPLCNLTPTFKDYEKFMQEIQQESKQEQGEAKATSAVIITNQSVVTAATTSTTSATPFFSNFKFNSTSPTGKTTGFGITAPVTSSVEKTDTSKEKTKETESIKSNGSGFSFGIKTPEKTNGNVGASTNFSFSQTKTNGDSQVETSKASTPFSFSGPTSSQPKSDTPGFSFGLKADTKPATTSGFNIGVKKDDAPSSSGFSFMPGSTPFMFANSKPPAAEPPKEGGGDDDDEDEPPKVEVKEIVEEDALFTKRCKVFVKKDNTYKDHGVGTFYLKPVKDTEKTQLLVRSSNNLGTILVNVILVEGMPTQRMGKNNVVLVHPGSAEDAKPQTTLFRVKDGAEADELFDMINKHKK